MPKQSTIPVTVKEGNPKLLIKAEDLPKKRKRTAPPSKKFQDKTKYNRKEEKRHAKEDY